MGLFARDEMDSKPEETAAEPYRGETRPAARREPTPIDAGRREREVSAHLGKGSRISGKLAFDGPARIDGAVDGEIVAQDTLTIEESAVVAAQIAGTTVVIKGKVTGNVRASERLELCASARLEGDVAAQTLVVHEGARFDGRCSMGGTESGSETRGKVAVVAQR